MNARVTEIAGLSDTTIPPEVTIAHCLSHSSGIADDADEESGEEYEDILSVSGNPENIFFWS